MNKTVHAAPRGETAAGASPSDVRGTPPTHDDHEPRSNVGSNFLRTIIAEDNAKGV